MDVSCNEFEGYNDEIQPSLEELDPTFVSFLDAFNRLIANTYEDEVAGVSVQRLTDEGMESGNDWDKTIAQMLNEVGPLYERCKAGLSPMIREIADGNKCTSQGSYDLDNLKNTPPARLDKLLKVIRFDETKAEEEAKTPSATQKDRLLDRISKLDTAVTDGEDNASKLEDLKEDVEKETIKYIREQTAWILAKERYDDVLTSQKALEVMIA